MKKASHEGTITINNKHVQCAILDSGERVLSTSEFADAEYPITYTGSAGESVGYLVTETHLVQIIDQALGYVVVKSDEFNKGLKNLLNLKKEQ